MQIISFLNRFSLIRYCFRIILFFFICGNAVANEKTVNIQLRCNIHEKYPLTIFTPRDALGKRYEKKIINLPPSGIINFTLKIPDFTKFTIHFKGTKSSFLVNASPDTLILKYLGSGALWEILKDPNYLNTTAYEIDRFADSCILKYAKPGVSASLRKAKALSDTLRLLYQNGKYPPEMAEYAHHTSIFLESVLGRKKDKDFIRFAFENNSQNPYNPAFLSSFRFFFENFLKDKLRGKDQAKWQRAILNIQTSDSLYELIYDEIGFKNKKFACYLILSELLSITKHEKFHKSDVGNLIQHLKSEIIDSATVQLIDFFEKRIEYTTRGNDIPDFTFLDIGSGKKISLHDIRGKPGYVAFLPWEENETIQTLIYLNYLNRKYNREIIIFAFVDRIKIEKLTSIIKTNKLEFIISRVEEIENFDPDLFEDSNQPGYLLFDKKGKIWQSPAESPETGIEAAFLGLIKR